MKKNILVSSIMGAMLLSSSLYAENTSVGAQVGLFGIGANVKYKINDQIGVRAGFDMFEINDFEVKDEEVTYNFDVKLQDIAVITDWHPWKGSFRTSAGLMINNSAVDGDLTPTSKTVEEINFTFNGTNYNYKINELGSIHTTADLNPIAPYIGIGWDTSFDKDKGFGFTFDLGVAFQGSIQVDYALNFGDSLDIDNLEGSAKDLAIARKQEIKEELETELDKEMITLQDELDKYEIMPYIAIGFNYKF